MRSQLRKKYMIKSIRKSDIHWKNIPLVTKFLNEAGKLMNRYQTRLPTSVHRKLARTVKHARNIGLLPFQDYIRPTDKVPLTTMFNNFLENTAKVVDKNTGKIKVIQVASNQDKFSYSNYSNSIEANKEATEQ